MTNILIKQNGSAIIDFLVLTSKTFWKRNYWSRYKIVKSPVSFSYGCVNCRTQSSADVPFVVEGSLLHSDRNLYTSSLLKWAVLNLSKFAVTGTDGTRRNNIYVGKQAVYCHNRDLTGRALRSLERNHSTILCNFDGDESKAILLHFIPASCESFVNKFKHCNWKVQT